MTAAPLLVALVVCGCVIPVRAQLFGDGIFNRKKKQVPISGDPGVPIPVSGKVETIKGQEIEFEIQARSKTPAASVEFLVRDFPIAGRIVSMVSKPGERNKAIVTYWADPNSAAITDSFSFAVRYRGGRYSSAVRFDIGLSGGGTGGSKIEVTKLVDFGKISIGEEVIKDIYVKNRGATPFLRQITLYPPWHVIEPDQGKISLSSGSTRKVRIAFRPTLVGQVNYNLVISRGKTGTSVLKGESIDPFSFSVQEAELMFDPKTRRRSAEIGIVSHSKSPLMVKTLATTRLKNSLRKTMILAPGDKNKLSVYLSENDVIPFEGAVELSLENGYGKSVNFFAKAVPGELSVTVPGAITSEVINFGRVPAGQGTERKLLIKNIGGEMVSLDFELAEPFRLMSSPPRQLAPQAELPISVGLFPGADMRGAADTVLKIFGNEKTISVRLLGNIVKLDKAFGMSSPPRKAAAPPTSSGNLPPSGSVNPVPAPIPLRKNSLNENSATNPAAEKQAAAVSRPPRAGSGGLRLDDSQPGKIVRTDPDGNGADYVPLEKRNISKEAANGLRSPLGFVTGTLVERDRDEKMKGAEDLEVVAGGKNHLTLGWTAPKESEGYSYEVELRKMIHLNDSPVPESVWVPKSGVRYEQIGRLVKADVRELAPNHSYEFRVITLNQNGKAAFPSEAIVGKTDLPADWTLIYLGGGVFLLFAIGLATWKIVRDHNNAAQATPVQSAE